MYTHFEKKLLLESANKQPEDVISLNQDLAYLINGFTYLTYGFHAHALMVLLKDNTAVTCILSDVYISHVD